MEIKKLHLKNFRNYKDEKILFSNNINLIYGENAQGKTNIIEALYLFATGKSHRTSNLNELVRYGESFFTILLEFEDNQYLQNMEIHYEKGKGKQLYINEVKKERMSDLLGIVPSVLFAPESLLSVKGSPGERRKLIDIVLCQVNKNYLLCLQNYNRIMKNKNVLLKEIQIRKQPEELLNVWNESLAKYGVKIIEERRKFIENLERGIKKLIQGISDGKENVNIKYKSFMEPENTSSALFYDLLQQNMAKEVQQGNCIIGPHRDDMEIYINDKNSRMYCSQGQQRSVALALNIAILEEIEERMEKTPLLLLDDVMSELDDKRQNYLLNLIGERQTFITATEMSRFKHIGKNNIFYVHIKDGSVLG